MSELTSKFSPDDPKLVEMEDRARSIELISNPVLDFLKSKLATSKPDWQSCGSL